MSYAAERWARSQTVGHSTAKAVLRELAFYHNGLTGLCCPSVSKIARVLEVKKADTITAAIRRLEEGGFISREFVRDPESGQILRTEYALIGFVASEWGHPKNQETSPEYQETSPENRGTVPQKTKRGSPEKRGEGSPKNRDVTGNKNREVEQVNRTGNTRAPEPDLIDDPVKKAETPTRSALKKPEGVSDEVWAEWKAHKRKVSKNCTQRMVDALVREAGIAGIPPEKAMTIQLEKGWRGFEAKYLENTKPLNRNRFVEKKQSERNYSLDW